MNFVLSGLKIAQDKTKGFLLSIDFSNFFKRECILDDMEKQYLTSFSDGCILGQRHPFWFKLPERICRRNPDNLMALSSEICDCKKKDFECEEGYVRDENNIKCVLNNNIPDLKKSSHSESYGMIVDKLKLSIKVNRVSVKYLISSCSRRI